MSFSYFLGANTGAGFVSLYAQFPPEEGAILHILKGSPGGGKSTLLRRIGALCEERGLAVQYVVCSGDPDSLDGVYVPALHEAWADGTAPHVIEPKCFGADADYVDLSRFLRLPLCAEDRERARSLTEDYRRHYRNAYAELTEAKRLHDELERVYRPYVDFAALDAFTESVLEALRAQL